jgi:SNF2 family DNA or RNA helicase
VPNSTVTNWVREFERWAPRLRTVPFYGDKNSRDVIKQFELFHESPPQGFTDTKFHVLITTYESVINVKDFAPVFKKQPRWEVSCLLSLISVDSGSMHCRSWLWMKDKDVGLQLHEVKQQPN